MGNPQHLEWLLEGVESWNERRLDQPFTPDFSDSDITQSLIAFSDKGELGLPLVGCNFEGANFSDATIKDIDFSGCNFANAIFLRADLRRSTLKRANLYRTDFCFAALDACDVSTVVAAEGGYLPTDLYSAESLDQGQIESMDGDTSTMLPPGLARPKHWPSLQDPAIKALSQNPARQALVEELSNFDEVVSVSSKATIYFISSSEADSTTTTHIVEKLRAAGLSVIYWKTDFPVGGDFMVQMTEAADKADVCLAIWSRNYKADYNRFSALERNAFLASDPDGKKASLIPVLLESVDLPTLYGTRIGFPLYQKSVEDLIDALTHRRTIIDVPARIQTSTPPVDVTWTRDGKLDAELLALDPKPRSALPPVNPEIRQELLHGIGVAAEEIKTSIRKNATANTQALCGDISGIFEAIETRVKGHESDVAIVSVRMYVSALKKLASDAEALSTVDKALYDSFLEECAKLLNNSPILKEIDDPHQSEIIPDAASDDISDAVSDFIDVMTDPETEDAIGPSLPGVTRDLDAYQWEDGKKRLAVFSTFAASIAEALNNPPEWVRAIPLYSTIAGRITAILRLL